MAARWAPPATTCTSAPADQPGSQPAADPARTSPLLFGGAAQLLAAQLLDAGASGVVVVLAALIVNARMLLYSAALAPHAADWPARWRWAAAYLLVDPVYTRPAYAAAATGGIVAVAATGLPLGLGLLVGAAAGIGVRGNLGRHHE